MTILKTLIAGGQICLKRFYATSPKFIEVTQDNGIEIISMARKPVNCLNTELLNELKLLISEAQNNRSKGIILTSSLPTVFSAGLDIMELFTTDKGKLIDFWRTLQDTWLTVYSSAIPIAAAINGSSPAGGCLFAMSTEYRVMVEGKHVIGLNETQLGMVAPKWFKDVYISLLGYRQAELALLKGAMFKPEKALQLGLIDELAKDKADAIEKCKNYILSFDNIPGLGRTITKVDLRNDLIQWLKENKKADTDNFVNYVQSPKVQDGLKLYVEYLKKK
ncbi:PREDICTED: enoyl-CoA delta isomerase 1, mitochondrial-like [Cyphomyrmex costatus]|uniref:Enoyl-CoA delta isomerase 1, mitochondrial n=1 Tax=Cyphomyrmex costatus TaxID=456900 RepID=A0A195BY33_9HYME|nr:PREDICTED: enoyl-CoA delta isomerase 1, mitochondrial-like [Cyphomyrmex costatus]XP_018405857.1 PREDICTED: enoyl-CoA delta isomerase 1, mitochondrial-like [Cyphomyrmex costatus]XP_018405858.1 PREDICTED: enoyl-CoA delta isomerase 1, mitochondrial-like [Cyphomyrmex costatus]XP_018405859.1 PREDICTED: enoyl-CoA delta isomerase 1, mitochondrial-like [Cyphomyrmex costatus]XP_018405860.1 PREDICTED: enoyl-CoA delta isomerase 1, mitochondrial-like [Cyphomyrmex costatus]KYM93502.1 3,2-trans-enoyl-CoA